MEDVKKEQIMPCWEVQTMSVEFSVKSLDSLRKAVENLGMGYSEYGNTFTVELRGSVNTIQLDLERGRANLSTRDQNKLNEIKRSYSEVVLEKVAAKKRWILKKKAANKFEMKRI